MKRLRTPVEMGLAGIGVAGFLMSTFGSYLWATATPVQEWRSVRMPTAVPADVDGPSRVELRDTEQRVSEQNAIVSQLQGDVEKLTKQKQQSLTHLEQARAAMKEKATQASPEVQKLRTDLKANQSAYTDWTQLGLTKSEQSELTAAWRAEAPPPTAPKLQQLIAAKTQSAKESSQRAAMAATSLAEKQASDLTAVMRSIDEAYQEALSRLTAPDLTERDRLIAAINDLLIKSQRAAPGQNFTNAAGIELVWLPITDYPGGGLWMGKEEVRMSAMKTILPNQAGNCSADEQGHVYRIVRREAVDFCSALTSLELTGPQESASPGGGRGGQVAPEGWSYDLPKAGESQLAASVASEFGLENFNEGVYEMVSELSGGRPVVVHGSSGSSKLRAQALPSDSRTFTQTGSSGAVQNAEIITFTGRVGFRIVLRKDG